VTDYSATSWATTTHSDTDLLGLGMSAISHLGDSFSQNHRDLMSWEEAVNADRLPVWRGLALSEDDCITQRSNRAADVPRARWTSARIEQRHHIDFALYFRDALVRLSTHVNDGLIRIEPKRIVVTTQGQMLARSVAMLLRTATSAIRTAHPPPRTTPSSSDDELWWR